MDSMSYQSNFKHGMGQAAAFKLTHAKKESNRRMIFLNKIGAITIKYWIDQSITNVGVLQAYSSSFHQHLPPALMTYYDFFNFPIVTSLITPLLPSWLMTYHLKRTTYNYSSSFISFFSPFGTTQTNKLMWENMGFFRGNYKRSTVGGRSTTFRKIPNKRVTWKLANCSHMTTEGQDSFAN